MFDDRNKLALVFLPAWVALFALGGSLAIPRLVSPKLETIAREALNADPSLAQLNPRFEGFSCRFTGPAASAAQLEIAYALVADALPAGMMRRQPFNSFPPDLPGRATLLPTGAATAAAAGPTAPAAPAGPAAPVLASRTAGSAPAPIALQPATAAPPAPALACAPQPAPKKAAAEPIPALDSPATPLSPKPVAPSPSSSPVVPQVAAPAPSMHPPAGEALPPPAKAAMVVQPAAPEAAAMPSRPVRAAQSLPPQAEAPPGKKPLVYVPEEWSERSDAGKPEDPPDALGPAHTVSPAATREVDEWTGTVFFDPDSSVLHESQLPILHRVAEDSKSRPGFRLRVVSFADPRGDPEFNTWLSNRRGERVRSELARLGMDLALELAVDFESATSPILQNPEIQRRVELRYIQ